MLICYIVYNININEWLIEIKRYESDERSLWTIQGYILSVRK